MKRLLFMVALLGVLFGTLPAHAATWVTFGGKQIGFTVRYPTSWKVTSASLPRATQITLSAPHSTGALIVTVLALKPAHTMAATLNTFLRYERAQGDPALAQATWRAASLGGRPARAAVLLLSTEGGVPQADGFYVAPWRTYTYEVMLVSHTKSSPRTVQQFPAIYAQVIRTWRFR